jgi:ParB/RepB/Spo0J family partition protein/excisionase family DNA binding protein
MSELIPLDRIQVFRNYRDELDLEHVREISSNMAAHGYDAAYPIELTAPDMSGTFFIVAGHHRYAAAIDAGLDSVHAVITDLEPGSLDYLTKQVKENTARKQSNPLEEGKAFQAMIGLGATVESIAADIARSRRYVEARLVAAGLDPVAQVLAVTPGAGLRYCHDLADLPAAMQAQLAQQLLAGQTIFSQESWRALCAKARDAWQESLQSDLFNADSFLVSQEWDTKLGEYVTGLRDQEQASLDNGTQLLTVEDIATRLGLSRATIHKYLQRGTMPAPDVRLGNTPGWLLGTVRHWENDREGIKK